MNAPAGGPPELNIEGPAEQWLAPPTPPQDWFSLARFEEDDDEEKPKKPEGIRLERLSDKDIGALMGKAWRNPITGQVHLKDFGIFPDFSVADLWTRQYLFGTAEQLAKDPYLFRPVPFPMRTWIYHYMFRMGRVLSVTGADEDGMIRHVLKLPVIDLPVRGGCWSPLMCYVPLVLMVCLTSDLALVVGGIIVVVLTLFIHWFLNTPDLYRIARLASVPIRIAFLVWLIMRVQANQATGTGEALAIVGFVLGFVTCLGEFGLGDGGALKSYRLHCSYEVLRALPNRIFICRRIGAAGSEQANRDIPPVNECVTGMGAWQLNYALIADVKGLIVELKPMSQNDWTEVYEERHIRGHRFIGLDIYNPSAPTVDALDANFEEQQLLIARNKMRQEWSQDGATSPSSYGKAAKAANADFVVEEA